jgi:drug/metabolite transporter (DMT)-like permease
MSWLIYSFLCAFSLATTDALSKRALEEHNPIQIAWVRLEYMVPFLLVIAPFITIPQLDATFWRVVILTLPLDLLAYVLYIEAIRVSPLSLTIPFLALTPTFLIGTSWVMVGEFPSKSGLVGILLVTMGAYLLNVHLTKEGIWGPLHAIRRERGSLIMVGVAFIYSLTSNLGKIAINHSSPLFFSVLYFTLLTIVFYIYALARGKAPRLFSKPKKFAPIGFFNAMMIITHFLGLELTKVSYLISIKRTSLLFSIFYGYVMFREENIRERLLGGLVMLAGAVLISLGPA